MCRLQIGSVSEEIRVSAQAALLETDNAVVGGTTNAKEIHDTPIPAIEAAALSLLSSRRAG